MHSAVGEGSSFRWEHGIYHWAPGPKSLGRRDWSPSNCVSGIGFLGNFASVGYNIDRAGQELMVRSSEAMDIRAMVREREYEKSRTEDRRGSESCYGAGKPMGAGRVKSGGRA